MRWTKPAGAPSRNTRSPKPSDMRVLLDECVPRPLGRALTRHHWSTVPKEGWSGFKNGQLLRAIEGRWDVLLTTDTNIPWQQATARFDLAVLIVRARSNDIDDLQPWVPEILRALPALSKGTVAEVGDPSLVGR